MWVFVFDAILVFDCLIVYRFVKGFLVYMVVLFFGDFPVFPGLLHALWFCFLFPRFTFRFLMVFLGLFCVFCGRVGRFGGLVE